MQTFRLAAAYALIFALAVSAPAAPVAAQSPTAATAPVTSEPAERTLGRTEAPAAPAGPTAATTALPVTALPQAATPASQAAEPTAGPAQGAVRSAATIGRMQRDLSPWSMFLSADILVKTVMIGLGFASLATWTIFFSKTIQLSRARRRLRLALKRVADARSLGEAQLALGATRSVVASLLAAAMQELRFSHEDTDEAGIKERAASRFAEIVRIEARTVRQGMAFLATVGATSPFVGLFGTVWGIMNSFIGISRAQTTNLAVVAPGIAEALLATAIGLAAAIPAVIMYNHFARATKGYVDLVGRGSGAIARLLSRDLGRARGRGRLATHAAE